MTNLDVPVFPPEIWLQISWYLDLPDLDSLAASSALLKSLTRDPALHRVRLLVFTPERISRCLFSVNRPSILNLVQWNILRGLGVERRWRTGQYLYSTLAIRQFNASVALQQTRTKAKLSTLLRTPRTLARATLYPHIIPDIEASSYHVARALLPTVHTLNSHIRRHTLARAISSTSRDLSWFEGKGRELGVVGESARLAVCPSVKKSVRAWEDRLMRLRYDK